MGGGDGFPPSLMRLDQDYCVGRMVKDLIGIRDRGPVLGELEVRVLVLRIIIELVLPAILLRVLYEPLKVVALRELLEFFERREYEKVVEVEKVSRVLRVQDVVRVELVTEHSQKPGGCQS